MISTIKKLSRLGLVAATLIFAVGCVQHAANAPRVADKTIDTTHSRAELVLASDKLLRKLVMTNVRFGTVGNFARAEVGMQNLSGSKLQLEYKIDWQDSQGFTINSNNTWHRFSLAPKEIKNLQSVGKTPEAARIQVVVRLPDDLFIESNKQQIREDKKWF